MRFEQLYAPLSWIMCRTVDNSTFRAGLMLGLAASGRKELPVGEPLYCAFLATVEGKDLVPRQVQQAERDPVFGTVPCVDQMILEAIADRLVETSTGRVCFRIDPFVACDELRKLVPELAGWFVELGKSFDSALNGTK